MRLYSGIMPSKRSISMMERAIENFMSQTYGPKELVVLRTSLNGVRAPHSCVRFYEVPEGLSVGELRNIACRLTRGSVIGAHDDDDTSHPERLARSMAAIDAGASLVGSSRVIFERIEESEPVGVFDGTRMSFSEPVTEVRYKRRRWLFDGAALKPKWIIGGTMVYRRQLWEDRPFDDVEQGEDSRFFAYWNTALPIGGVVDMADESMYTATLSADATSKKDLDSPGWEVIE